jgi:glutamyl endopeptidase
MPKPRPEPGGEEVARPTEPLDAWYAEYPPDPISLGGPDPTGTGTGSDAANALAARIVQELIIGTDDRIPSPDTTEYPYQCVCALEITAADGTVWRGSGALVSADVVLTCGHNVYLRNHGGWARQITVWPGRDGSTIPFGPYVGRRFRTVAGWVNDKRPDADYGAILLESTGNGGSKPGVLAYKAMSPATLKTLGLNLAGYPGDKPSFSQWYTSEWIVEVEDRILRYSNDTMPGNSGSCPWVVQGGERFIVGVHTNGALTTNWATRVTSGVVRNVDAWIGEA